MNAIANETLRAIPSEKIVDLDVKPILSAGGEPFSQIMDAISRTPEDGAMRLLAPFKPSPLFGVLGSQGWSHWIEKGEGDDWVIWFYRAKESDRAAAEAKIDSSEIDLAHLQKENPELQKRLRAEGDKWTIDVRRLSPPQPMELTLCVLEKLPESATLTQLNERIPQFLFPMLEERGFEYRVFEGSGSEVRVEIRRKA